MNDSMEQNRKPRGKTKTYRYLEKNKTESLCHTLCKNELKMDQSLKTFKKKIIIELEERTHGEVLFLSCSGECFPKYDT